MARDQHCKIDRQPRVSLKFGEGEQENTQKNTSHTRHISALPHTDQCKPPLFQQVARAI